MPHFQQCSPERVSHKSTHSAGTRPGPGLGLSAKSNKAAAVSSSTFDEERSSLEADEVLSALLNQEVNGWLEFRQAAKQEEFMQFLSRFAGVRFGPRCAYTSSARSSLSQHTKLTQERSACERVRDALCTAVRGSVCAIRRRRITKDLLLFVMIGFTIFVSLHCIVFLLEAILGDVTWHERIVHITLASLAMFLCVVSIVCGWMVCYPDCLLDFLAKEWDVHMEEPSMLKNSFNSNKSMSLLVRREMRSGKVSPLPPFPSEERKSLPVRVMSASAIAAMRPSWRMWINRKLRVFFSFPPPSSSSPTISSSSSSPARSACSVIGMLSHICSLSMHILAMLFFLRTAFSFTACASFNSSSSSHSAFLADDSLSRTILSLLLNVFGSDMCDHSHSLDGGAGRDEDKVARSALSMQTAAVVFLLPVLLQRIFPLVSLKFFIVQLYFSLVVFLFVSCLTSGGTTVFGGVVAAFLSFLLMRDFQLKKIILFLSTTDAKAILVSQNKALEESYATEMRHLIANVAHDLKTPLASFTTGLDLIQLALDEYESSSPRNDNGSSSCAELVQVVQSCVSNIRNTNLFMLMTINRCIDYTKVSKGIKLLPRQETIDLLEAVQLPLQCMRNIQSSVQIVMLPLHPSVCSHIITDKLWLQENLLCLLSNAVKYSSGGEVTISIRVEGCEEREREIDRERDGGVEDTMQLAAGEEEDDDDREEEEEEGGNDAEEEGNEMSRASSTTTALRLQMRTRAQSQDLLDALESGLCSSGHAIECSELDSPRAASLIYDASPRHPEETRAGGPRTPTAAGTRAGSSNNSVLFTEENIEKTDALRKGLESLFARSRPVLPPLPSASVKVSGSGSTSMHAVPASSPSNSSHSFSAAAKASAAARRIALSNSFSLSSPPLALTQALSASPNVSLRRSEPNMADVMRSFSAKLPPADYDERDREMVKERDREFERFAEGENESESCEPDDSSSLALSSMRAHSMGLLNTAANSRPPSAGLSPRRGRTEKNEKSGKKKKKKHGNSKADAGSERESDRERNIPLLVIEVEDAGIGLSDAAMEMLFKPFNQTQRHAGGTGLGLFSLAKRVEALKGKYGVRRRRDGQQGSLFWFAIPYRTDEIMAQIMRENMLNQQQLLQSKEEERRAATIAEREMEELKEREVERKKNKAKENEQSPLRSGLSPRQQGKKKENKGEREEERKSDVESEKEEDEKALFPVIEKHDSDASTVVPSINFNTNSLSSHSSHISNKMATNVQKNVITSNNTNNNINGGSAGATTTQTATPSGSKAKSEMGVCVEAPQNNATASSSVSPLNNALRILVVDDSPAIVKMTSMMLRKLGHVVSSAENGQVAVNLIQSTMFGASNDVVNNNSNQFNMNEGKDKLDLSSNLNNDNDTITNSKTAESLPPFDVILMDLQMPVMDGLEATKRIRRLESNNHVKRKKLWILGCSANSDSETQEAALAVGMDHFMTKPFNVTTFFNAVNELNKRTNKA